LATKVIRFSGLEQADAFLKPSTERRPRSRAAEGFADCSEEAWKVTLLEREAWVTAFRIVYLEGVVTEDIPELPA